MPYLILWHPRVRTDTDAATVYIDLQPITVVEAAEFSDAAEVYLDIQPGSIFLQVDFVLEIIEYTKRWATDAVRLRWAINIATGRWTVVKAAARWAVMETRRFLWRS